MPFEKDDFWDIEKLLPKKKSTLSPFSTKEKTVEFKIPGEEKEPDSDTALTLIPSERTKEEDGNKVYVFNEGFIKKVTIKRFIDKYDFYGNFRKAALVYYDFKTPKCEFVPFFSYMPQYTQFNPQQKNFYFYWRDCARRGKYIKTDYSYFYLYIYEILNLPDKIPIKDGLSMLISLWKAYRSELPNIDTNMSLWVQDYCLVYNLPCPMEEIGEFIFDVIGAAEFKEFYLCSFSSMRDDGISALVAYLSDYDWRKGKYAGGDNREVYSKHLMGAMGLLIGELWEKGQLFSNNYETAKLTRSAFRNSLCTHSVKCQLEIEYISLAKVESVRNSFTAALKYTENKLRALLGVKSRLAIKELPDEYRFIIDNYFKDIFNKAQREHERTSMPEYEKLYDAEAGELSFAGADEIERASWTTTARLVVESDEFFEDKLDNMPDLQNSVSETKYEENTVSDNYGLSEDEIIFIKYIKELNTAGIKEISAKIGMIPNAIVEKINEAFSDGFGDVIIEGDDPEFTIIIDYEDDIEEWLSKRMK